MARETVAGWIKDMLPRKCMNCDSKTGLTYHHIVPVILGGNEVPGNVKVLCSKCHNLTHYGKDGNIDHGALVKAGMQQAKERGVRLGRKPADEERVMRLIAEKSTQFNYFSETTEHEIMMEAGVKGVCYAKHKRKLIELINGDSWPYEWAKPRQIRNRPLYPSVIKELRGECSE